jgi:hypothetical protein
MDVLLRDIDVCRLEGWTEGFLALAKNERVAFRVPALIIWVTEDNMTLVAGISERVNLQLQMSVSKSSFAQEMLAFHRINDMSPEEVAKKITPAVSVKPDKRR